MEDNNNLPMGTSSFDGYQAGVNRWDDSYTAGMKVLTHELGKQYEAQKARMDAEDASRTTPSSYTPAYRNQAGNPRVIAPRGPDLSSIRQSNIMTTSYLAQAIEFSRRAHEEHRARSTQAARKLRSVAIALSPVLLAIVVLGVKLPFIPCSYGLAEYLAVRLLLVACVFTIFKTSSFIKKAYSSEEKRLDELARCMLEAVKTSYNVKVKKSKNDIFGNHLFGRYEVPQMNLTAKFLHEFNQAVLRTTGAAMPYEVYRFKEFWDRAFFIPPKKVPSDNTIEHCDRVPLKDLERLASQGI